MLNVVLSRVLLTTGRDLQFLHPVRSEDGTLHMLKSMV